MRTFRTVSTEFWTDPKVENFTPVDKLVYLYLITNPHTNICGCYEVTVKKMHDEIGYTKDECKEELNRLQNMFNVIKYDEENNEVIILNWGRYNWNKSEKMVRAVEKVAAYIKTEEFRKIIAKKLNEAILSESETETELESEYRNRNSSSSSSVKYPIDRVSKNQKKVRNFTERQYDYEALEGDLVKKG